MTQPTKKSSFCLQPPPILSISRPGTHPFFYRTALSPNRKSSHPLRDRLLFSTQYRAVELCLLLCWCPNHPEANLWLKKIHQALRILLRYCRTEYLIEILIRVWTPSDPKCQDLLKQIVSACVQKSLRIPMDKNTRLGSSLYPKLSSKVIPKLVSVIRSGHPESLTLPFFHNVSRS